MDPITLALLGGLGLFLLFSKKAEESDLAPESAPSLAGPNIDVRAPQAFEPYANGMGLPDVMPSDQGGNWLKTYDDDFYQVSQEKGVPFALLKAHAIRESALKKNAYRSEPGTSKRPPSASYGLLQILWWRDSNRFAKWGYSDNDIGDGSILYDPVINGRIAAEIILSNFNQFGNLRDTINAYNTGVGESVREAPNDYVDDVLSTYSTLVGREVS